ncbi:BamA/TamA family outer membrane protein [Agaribacterium haliotis]|uniref:BamA/TamA family outer membrane protein n=1 Tax=Agaribacterium haliotis TaxID=2013869 RepID=UPI0013040D27|nr:BamA/TamA family outer membrane protein [Agaribacterium haliotis]
MHSRIDFSSAAARRALVVFLLLALASTGNRAYASQFFDPLDGKLDFSTFLSQNAYGFLPVPIIITDPSVDGGLGMAGLFFNESEENKNKRLQAMKNAQSNAGKYLLPPNVTALAGAYTGNDSWFVGGGHLGFFRNGAIRYAGGGGGGSINLDFYGFGSLQLPKPITINTEALAVVQSLKFRVAESRWFAGLTQNYIKAELGPKNLGSLDNVLPPEWSDELKQLLTVDVTTSALGVVLEYDSRDNIFTPLHGYQYQLNWKKFDEALGSDLNYDLSSFQGLNFWPLSRRWNLGLKLQAEQAANAEFLPPFALPSIQLRGIPAMRYQGMKVAMAETELGYALNSRWRTLVFAGSGLAATSGEDLFDTPKRNAYGLGFRYRIARRYGMDMGMDFAEGPDGLVWYITAGSAWTSI